MNSFVDEFDFQNEWKKFIRLVEQRPNTRKITMEAWKRCEDLGLSPDKIKFVFLSDEELKQKQKENRELIEAAAPYMDHLSLSLAGIPHMVALLDTDAWVISERGTSNELGGRMVGLCEGASWAEERIGNNGGGTALTTQQPVLIYGVEHFGQFYNSVACIGVPILQGKNVIGALDVSVPTEFAHPSRLGLVTACVKSIETSLGVTSPEDAQVINAQERLSEIGDLMVSAIHDLKNPLAVIRGLGQLGSLTAKSRNASEYFERIIKQTDGLTQMVADLLDIFKPEKPVTASPVPFLQDVIDENQLICKSKGIMLDLIIVRDNQVMLFPKLFKRAIQNLVDNATKVLTDGGNITIEVNTDDNDLIIFVKDTGPGIPVDIKDNLFDPFVFRRNEGTGIGLFTVHRIITDVHNGQIIFETDTGKGTTFYIRIPLAHNERG